MGEHTQRNDTGGEGTHSSRSWRDPSWTEQRDHTGGGTYTGMIPVGRRIADAQLM